ncbi:sigma 54-interacting transcriptional regulator [Clostridium sediminicola]|uniref:sigma 54-interacting transcriptional regulator n=1 Tax=Clostridium sediminicola TaxID=3114879 RepID=UPI0031F1F474
MEDINSRINELIKNEDKKKPYKDIDLAKMAGCERGYITQIRKKLDIPDSRIRLKTILEEEINKIISEDENVKPGQLIKILKQRGFSVTRYLVNSILNEINTSSYEKTSPQSLKQQNDSFESIIGHDESLAASIKLAKAAVLYPPKGLNTLIIGKSGVGKSLLAKTMFEFGKSNKIFSQSSEFVSFNCADYADNPQLLLSILFGVKKGAFTGAENTRQGLIERANGGVLFLDEIHRMPPKGQEILFQLIDLGKYRPLGESENEREIQTLIIGATTEKPEECLLDTFQRRIPMTIKLPSLVERPIVERLQLIEWYLTIQARQLGKAINITRDACYSYLLYEPIGNIGKMFNDIQVCLAKGYLKSLTEESKEIIIELSMLPKEAQKGILKTHSNRKMLRSLISNDGLIVSVDDKNRQLIDDDISNLNAETIYNLIDDRYLELINTELKSEEINEIIGEEIEYKIKNRIEKRNKTINKSMIIKIIGANMTNLVEKALEHANEIIESYDAQFFYSIALHIKETINRVKMRKKIVNPKLLYIKEKYIEEYKAAQKITEFISTEIGYKIPDEEAGFIAMYLGSYLEKKIEPYIGILVITHGHIAKELVEIGQTLMGKANISSIEMPLEESPKNILRKAAEEVQLLNQGKGVLIMVDMGSLATFAPLINETTGIPIKTVKRVEIVLLMEAIRMSRRMEITLDELSSKLNKSTVNSENDFSRESKEELKPLLITTCMTGQGTSIYLKEMLDRTLENIDIEIMALGVLTKEGLLDRIKYLKQQFNIICVVGTINPKLEDIPFISMNEVITSNIQEKIEKIYKFKTDNNTLEFDKDLIYIKTSMKDKKSVIEFLCNQMKNRGYVTDKYIEEVWVREEMGLTCLYDVTEKGVAIIHSSTSKEILKSGFAVMKVNKPFKWDVIDVDVIFVMATNTHSADFPEHFNRKVLRNVNIMDSIRNCNNKNELIKLMEKIV